MSDTFTTTTRQGWGARLGGSLRGILMGIVMFVASFVLLWWNEGRTVKQTRALNEGGKAVVEASADVVEAAKEGQLVHVVGVATNLEWLKDAAFDVSADALVLRRQVEMYQWVEHSKTSQKVAMGGAETTTTEYSYEKAWADGRQASEHFAMPDGHQNPAQKYESEYWVARAKLGAYDLPGERLLGLGGAERIEWEPEWIPAAERVAMREAEIAAAKASTGAESAAAVAEGDGDGESAAEAPAEEAAAAPVLVPLNLEAEQALDAAKPLKKVRNGFYYGKNPDAPEVGDLRIEFTEVKARDVSVVAAQQGSGFGAWVAKNGRTIFLMSDGRRSAAEMFESAHSANKLLAWLLRLAGFALMCFGLKGITYPLKVLADVLPFLGSIVGWLMGTASFLVALPLTLLTIGLAWVAYRPLVGIPLLVAAGALAFWGIARKKNVTDLEK